MMKMVVVMMLNDGDDDDDCSESAFGKGQRNHEPYQHDNAG